MNILKGITLLKSALDPRCRYRQIPLQLEKNIQ